MRVILISVQFNYHISSYFIKLLKNVHLEICAIVIILAKSIYQKRCLKMKILQIPMQHGFKK